MTSQYDKEVQFTCAVRGYHYYRREWQPEVEETLDCSHEKNNLFDRFAIKTISKKTGQIVGHLPIEVSRITKYLMDRGAEVTAKLTSDHYRRSPSRWTRDPLYSCCKDEWLFSTQPNVVKQV